MCGKFYRQIAEGVNGSHSYHKLHPAFDLRIRAGLIVATRTGCSGQASFGGEGMSRWPFLLKHLSYGPVNPFDSFHTWRESTDPTSSNSLDQFTGFLLHRRARRAIEHCRLEE